LPKEPPRLDSGLIVRKGEAAPAINSSARPLGEADVISLRAIPKGIAGTIAVTVRLDPARYERLKLHGVRNRKSNQEILVAALDTFLAAGGA
jgi:hypothetical protein